jgi:regulator of protease activity HflC (stomatin/prohibitin superfamily)
MRKLIPLGALVFVIFAYFLAGLTGLAVAAVIVALMALSYRLARETGLARAILVTTLILSLVLGGLAGWVRRPDQPGVTMAELAFLAMGGAVGLFSWLLAILSALFLCSEVIFVSQGGNRRESFIYLLESVLLQRAGPLEVVSNGEAKTIKSRSLFAPARTVGYTVVNHGNAVVFERFGRPSRVSGPGLVIKQPFETIRAVLDLRMQVEERTQTFCTRDGIPLNTHTKVFFQIDPGSRPPTRDNMFPFSEPAVFNAVYLVPDWKTYTIETALALLRDMICKCYLDEIYDPLKKGPRGSACPDTHAQLLQDKLQTSLSTAASAWGVSVRRVELGIAAPREIEQQALAFEKARKEEGLESQRSKAESRRIKDFISQTGADVTDYAMLRYLEKVGEAGLVPPSLERMFLESIQKESTISPKSEGRDRDKDAD